MSIPTTSNTSEFNTSNMNGSRARYEPKFDVKFHSCLLVISFLIITTNIPVIVLFMAKESLRKGGKLLLCSLAISDLTTGLVTIPLNIACETTFSLSLCISSGNLNRFIAISTIYHILAVTFETYYAILRPMEHRVNIARGKILGIISGIWFVSLLISATPLSWYIDQMNDIRSRPTKEFLRKQTIYEIFVFAFGLILPVVLMVFAHVRMFTTIYRALKLVRRRSLPLHYPSNTNKYKTALLFAIILVVFIFSWSFWFAASLVNVLGKVKHPIPLWVLDSLTIIRYSTSFINPLLYTFFRPDFHKAIKKFLRMSGPSTSFTYLLGGTGRPNRESNFTFSKETSVQAVQASINPVITTSTTRIEYDTRV